MARSFVWAIGENGEPEKCYASPENRGKGRCNHRFHAEEGEERTDFLEKMGYDKSSAFKIERPKMVRMPNQEAKATRLMTEMDKRNRSWVDIVRSSIEDNYYLEGAFEGVEYNIEDGGVDPNDEHMHIVKVAFIDNGNVYEREFSIPDEDELGRLYINGTAYRYIPNFVNNNVGVNVSHDGNLAINNNYNRSLIFSNKGKDTCNICVKEEEDGRYRWHNGIPVDEVDKALNGEDNTLSEEERAALDTIHPFALERIKEEGGIAGLKELPPDVDNDITNRSVWTYQDSVSHVLGKQFRSLDSTRKRLAKDGKQFDYKMDNVTDNIKKNLINNSQVQLADDLNPIAILCQRQRISWCGNGFSSIKDLPKGVRFPHESYRGMIDHNDVSLGGKVGVTIGLKSTIGEYGILEYDKKKITGSDFIPYLEHSDPNRASMAISQMRQACPIVGGEDPEVSTRGWDKIKGSKLGVNLTTAYVPMGEVWEDAVVISESAAAKMTAKKSSNYKSRNTEEVRQGDRVHRGDFIGGQEIKHDGVIKNVTKDGFEVESTYAMGVGDKIAGRYGNKGVVSKILPDSEMPKVDGKTADIIMSPISVAGRSNLGQIYEVNKGDFNKKSTIEYNGKKYSATGGTQFIMRVNQIAEEKLKSNSNSREHDGEFKSRFGEMENLLMTQSEERLEILDYLQNQERRVGNNKLAEVLKSVGVDIKPIKQ